MGKLGTRKTFMHQSGALPLQPLHPSQDKARGMFSTIVTSDNFRKELFDLRAGEDKALAIALPWLVANNPWHKAYKSSLNEVDAGLNAALEKFAHEGHTLPAGINKLQDSQGNELQKCLGKEAIGMLIPFKTLSEYSGSYQHHRAAANYIFESELRSALPESWQKLHDCEIVHASGETKGASMWSLPEPMRQNLSFTKVSWRDCHVEAKAFVLQHRYGTGGFKSTAEGL